MRGISKGHVSLAIEKLVKRGLVTRNPDPVNRRWNILCEEKKADELVKKIQNIQHAFDEQAYQNISQEDIVKYHEILQQVYHNLGGGQHE